MSKILFALEIDYLVGVNFKKTQAKISHDIDVNIPTPFGTIVKNINYDETIKDKAPELKIGLILNNIFRVYLSAVEYKTELFKIKIITGNYEYLIPITDNFRFFAGTHLGVFENNMIYGAQAGTIFDITKNIELEIGGLYSKYKKDVEINGYKNGFEYKDTIAIKNSSSIYTGLNFKF